VAAKRAKEFLDNVEVRVVPVNSTGEGRSAPSPVLIFP
jgi:hypothetical protein